MRVIFSRGHLATSRDVFDDHKWGWGMWGEARDAAKHSIRQGTFSTPKIKNGPTPNVNSANAGKSCSGEYTIFSP